MKLLNAFLIAAVSVVAAACSKNEPVKIIETPAETVYSGTMTVVAGARTMFPKMSMSMSISRMTARRLSSSTRSSSFLRCLFLWMSLFPESNVNFAKMRSFFQATTSFRWPWECLMQNIK